MARDARAVAVAPRRAGGSRGPRVARRRIGLRRRGATLPSPRDVTYGSPLSMGEYVLGTDERELARLEFQQSVWGGVTERFLDRLAIPPGARCLDVGCGPGFVVESLRARAGDSGEVTALDESPRWMASLSRRAAERGWKNVKLVEGTVESAPLEEGAYDVVFLRWVLSFLERPGDVVRRLAAALRPGGVLAIQDYNHEGVSLFPESDGFRAVVAATRRLYATRHGDPWVAARLPRLFAEAGLEPPELTPNVLCGGPGSPAFRWADLFFVPHSESMVRAGVLREEDRAAFLRDWEERRRDPHAMFFSPIVVDASARKPRAPRGAR